MHHQEYTGDPPGTATRRTAFHHRRGSSSASGSPSSSTTTAAAGGNPSEEGPGSTQAGSSSSQALQALGAQVKKKSGFQITSVTSAQISGNNSLADDTESYDDMDESHTEDLSSSEMLDVSTSRAAADTGVPERSSSDETLNSLHGVDTPGLTSPNEPLHLHHVVQGSSLVNGSVHHQVRPHHSDPALPTLPVAPIASSSPALVQRPLVQDNPKPAANTLSVVKAPASAAAISDSATTQAGHSHPAPGSRFRVVKLDTNSEPFRKGRWTCTEYYEKEVPQPEPPKAADVAAEVETGNAGATLAVLAPLQPYHSPTQDFAGPLALTQTAPQGYVPPKPVAPPVVAASPPYVGDPQSQGGYAAPQHHAGVDVHQAGIRQPDFIQPTAPFQTQVQPPLPRVSTGMSPPVVPLQHPQGQVAPPGPAAFTSVQPPPHPLPRPQLQHPSVANAALQGAPYNPLTTLQADLQPLLTLGANLGHVPGGGFAKNTELENAKKFLIQHQRLLDLPRLGVATGREGAAEAHTGMSAFMAAAGFRSQHTDGEDDR